MDISQPFIRLPFRADAEIIASELRNLPESAWMAHPSRMQGNSAAALISREGQDNDDFAGRMAETSHLAACPYTRQVMASFGEVLGRSRFMKLAAGAEVAQHVDFNYHWVSRVRIHIPVITNPGVTFFCADQKIHMAAGDAWIFNAWRRHRVTNESSEDRVHLVIDTAGSSRFWKMIREVAKLSLQEGNPDFEAIVRNIEFNPETEPALRTEQFNISPVMSPGEVDAIAEGIIRDFAGNRDNNPALVEQYISLLTDFCKDWRENWAVHGFSNAGLDRYRELVESTQARLQADPRALVTQSNKIGVNPIIVQRLLRAALADEERVSFRAALD